MADIAILVAEEYERRVKKNERKGGLQDLVSCVSGLAQTLQKKKKIGHEKMDYFVKWVKEPRSQVGLEASNGFFSA